MGRIKKRKRRREDDVFIFSFQEDLKKTGFRKVWPS